MKGAILKYSLVRGGYNQYVPPCTAVSESQEHVSAYSEKKKS